MSGPEVAIKILNKSAFVFYVERFPDQNINSWTDVCLRWRRAKLITVWFSYPGPRKNKVWSPDQNNVRTINKEDCHFQLLMGFITNFGGFTLAYSKLKQKWKDEGFAPSATVSSVTCCLADGGLIRCSLPRSENREQYRIQKCWKANEEM